MLIKKYDFRKFVKYFSDNRIHIIVQRNYENLPSFISNDLDIEIGKDQYKGFIKKLFVFADMEGFQLFKFVDRPHVTMFKFFRNDNDKLEIALIDVHNDGASWYGLNYLSNEEIFKSKLPYKTFFIPAAFHETIIKIFVNLLIGSTYPVKYAGEISKKILGHEHQFLSFLNSSFPGINSHELYQKFIGQQVSDIQRFIIPLKIRLFLKYFQKQPVQTLNKILRVIWAEIFFYLQKNGLFIVLIGPDGVGKTTLADKMFFQMRSVFKNKIYFHWIPPPFSKLTNELNLQGKRIDREVKSSLLNIVVLSPLRLLKNWVKLQFFYWLRIFANLFRDRLIIADRYAFPYLYDPQAVKYVGPDWLLTFFFKFIPKPDLVLVLEATPEVILSRKKELNREQIIQIYQNISLIKENIKNTLVASIDANKSAEEMLAQSVCHIFNFLVNRNSRRLSSKFYSKVFINSLLKKYHFKSAT